MAARGLAAVRGVVLVLLAMTGSHAFAQTPALDNQPAYQQAPIVQAPVIQSPLPPSQQYRPPAYPTAPQAAPSSPGAGASLSSPQGATTAYPPNAPSPPSLPPNSPGPGLPAPPAAQSGPAVVPNIWVPQGSATLQALDKVNAQNATLAVKVGQSAKFGSLVIAVQACDIRPPDQPADAAAYLVVTDSHADSPGFKGWMLKKEPQVNMLEHPIYDLRLTGCAP